MVVLAVFIYFFLGLGPESSASCLQYQPTTGKQLQRERMVSSCVKSLQLATGYEKGMTQAELKLILDNVPESVLQVVLYGRYERVKCGYVFNAAYHAYMIDGLLVSEATESLASLGPSYEESVRLMIVTLYNGGVRRMDGLWMMYLHLHQMNGPTARDSHQQQSVKTRFSQTNASVLEKLRRLAKWSKCDAGNEFNAFDENSACRRKLDGAASRTEEIARLMEVNVNTVIRMIDNNKTIGLDTTDHEYFRADALYFDHLLAKDDVLDELLGAYDVQVDSEAIKAVLASRYEKARQLDLAADGTAPLESYQLAVIDTLKMILFRLVWKYVMLSNVKTFDFISGRGFSKLQADKKVVLHAIDWFAGYFGIRDDRQFLNVSKRLSELDTNTAAEALLKELTRISSSLACTLTEKPELGTTVFDSNHMAVTSYPSIDAQLYRSVVDEDISKYEKPFSKPFRNMLDVCRKHNIAVRKIKPLSEIDEKDLILISLYVFQRHVQRMFKDIHMEMIRSFQTFPNVDYQSDETISELIPEMNLSNEDFYDIFGKSLCNE